MAFWIVSNRGGFLPCTACTVCISLSHTHSFSQFRKRRKRQGSSIYVDRAVDKVLDALERICFFPIYVVDNLHVKDDPTATESDVEQ